MFRVRISRVSSHGVKRIKVTILKQGAEGKWAPIDEAEEGLRRPSNASVRAELPPKYRSMVRASLWRSSLEDIIAATIPDIPPDVWADTIAAIVLRAAAIDDKDGIFSRGTEADAFVGAQSPAVLLVGTSAYKLVPTRLESQATQFTAMRARVKEAAMSERRALVDSGAREAGLLVAQAQDIRVQAARELAVTREGLQRVVPEWLDRPVKFFEGDERIWVEVWLTFKPTKYSLSRLSRTFEFSAEDRPALKVRCWLPFGRDGAYSVKEMKTQEIRLPHVDFNGCCVSPQGLPRELKSGDGIRDVEAILNRAFSVVNLSSLLVAAANWPKDVKAFCPKALYRALVDSGPDGMNPEAVMKELSESEKEGAAVALDNVAEASFVFSI